MAKLGCFYSSYHVLCRSPDSPHRPDPRPKNDSRLSQQLVIWTGGVRKATVHMKKKRQVGCSLCCLGLGWCTAQGGTRRYGGTGQRGRGDGEMRSGEMWTSRRAIVRLMSASQCSNIVAGLG